MPRTLRVNPPPLHPGQIEVALDPARFRVLVCGRRWGKTRLCAVIAIGGALEGGRWWWVAPTYSITGVAWRLCKALVKAIPGVQVRESERCLLMPGGGSLWFKSADKPDNLRGEGLDGVVVDEADFCPEAVWTDALRPALSDKQGRAVFASTPNREGGWFHRCFKRGQNDREPSWKSWQWPSLTNPFLVPAEIHDARLDLPAITYRREYGAEFVSAAGARVQREWIKTTPPPPVLRVSVGVDLAISTKATADYTACVALGRAKDGNVWVLDAQRRRAPFNQVLRFIESFSERWSPSIVAVEMVAYQAAAVQELLRTTKLPVRGVKPTRDKLSRFAPLEARYEQGLIHHAPALPAAFEDELLSFPVCDHDDQIDAMAYAWGALPAGTGYKGRSKRSAARQWRH